MPIWFQPCQASDLSSFGDSMANHIGIEFLEIGEERKREVPKVSFN